MNDSISRQAALDALNGEITVTGRANAEAVLEYANLITDRIKRLPSAQPEQRWISVTERKPKKGDTAIVTDFDSVTLAYLNDLGEWMEFDGNRLKGVTAWMPLPEPYREET